MNDYGRLPTYDKCGFTEIGMDKIEKELFRFKNFADDLGVEFFLVAGVCLGLVRDGALINSDKDFDLGVMGDKGLKILLKELGDYYDEAHITGGKNGKILWLKKYFAGGYCLPIEIQVHYIKGDYVYYNRDLGTTWKFRAGRLVWDKRFFDNFAKIEFRGIDFNIPNPVEDFLTAHYGGDWHIPKEYTDWRYNCVNIYEGHWL